MRNFDHNDDWSNNRQLLAYAGASNWTGEAFQLERIQGLPVRPSKHKTRTEKPRLIFNNIYEAARKVEPLTAFLCMIGLVSLLLSVERFGLFRYDVLALGFVVVAGILSLRFGRGKDSE